MSLKEEKVQELVNTYNIPSTVAAMCVNDVGIIDQEKVSIAANTVSAMKDNLTVRDQAEIETLKGHLKECQEQAKLSGVDKMALAQRMISIKSRLYYLGGRL